MKFIEVDEPIMYSDDIFYDLFDGGYIKPEKFLADIADINRVNYAISVVQEFLDGAITHNILQLG